MSIPPSVGETTKRKAVSDNFTDASPSISTGASDKFGGEAIMGTISNNSASLCQICGYIITAAIDLFNPWGTGQTHPDEHQVDFHNLKDWKTSVKSCNICAILMHGTGIIETEYGKEDDSIKLQANVYAHEWGWCAIKLDSEDIYNLEDLTRTEIKFQEGNYVELYENLLSRNWSENTIELVKEWLDDCDSKHSQCRVVQITRDPITRHLPTRLIDTRPFIVDESVCNNLDTCDPEESSSIQLKLTSGMSRDLKYLTLSHSWGQHPSVAWGRHPGLTLTNETLKAFHRTIPITDTQNPYLRVFQEAVQVVRDLGFRYLWIDALCINQDDPEEKLRELSLMDEIYVNTTLNISATSTNDGSGQLISSRDVLSIQPYLSDISVSYYGQEISGVLAVFKHKWPRDVTNAPLNQRGWVLQERVLSPRILHFTPDEVYWDCSLLQASESFCLGIPDLRFNDNEPSFHIKDWHRLDEEAEHNAGGGLFKLWSAVIQSYSKCRLTFPNDKLVAVSGIARRICRMLNMEAGDYIAGLWKPILQYQLLWQAGSSSEGHQFKQYRAPSWSWASSTSRVYGSTFRPFKEEPVAVDIIDASVILKTPDPFGEIRDGRLVLRGPLCAATCVKNDDFPCLESEKILETPHHFSSEGAGTSTESKILLRAPEYFLIINNCRFERGFFYAHWDVDTSDWLIQADDEALYEREVTVFPPYLVYFMIFWQYPKYEDPGLSRQGLILVPTNLKRGQYRRIGMFDRWEESPTDELSINEAFQSNSLTPDTYIDWDGSDKYTIEVV